MADNHAAKNHTFRVEGCGMTEDNLCAQLGINTYDSCSYCCCLPCLCILEVAIKTLCCIEVQHSSNTKPSPTLKQDDPPTTQRANNRL